MALLVAIGVVDEFSQRMLLVGQRVGQFMGQRDHLLVVGLGGIEDEQALLLVVVEGRGLFGQQVAGFRARLKSWGTRPNILSAISAARVSLLVSASLTPSSTILRNLSLDRISAGTVRCTFQPVMSDSVRSMSSTWEKIGFCAKALPARVRGAAGGKASDVTRVAWELGPPKGTIETHMADDKLYKSVYDGQRDVSDHQAEAQGGQAPPDQPEESSARRAKVLVRTPDSAGGRCRTLLFILN